MNNAKNNSRYILKPTLTTWISIILLLSILPLGIVLPNWWGWENGPIEWTQVALLGLSLIFSLLMAWNSRNDHQFADVWAWSSLLWVNLIGRDLSWGRVFFPIGNDFGEPKFISRQELFYGRYIHPTIAVMIIALIVGLWRTGKVKKFLKTMPVPVLDVIIIVVATVFSTVYESGIIKMVHQYHQILEELSELCVYWAMFSMIFIIGQKSWETRRVVEKPTT
jgi:hypothetical protein